MSGGVDSHVTYRSFERHLEVCIGKREIVFKVHPCFHLTSGYRPTRHTCSMSDGPCYEHFMAEGFDEVEKVADAAVRSVEAGRWTWMEA